MMIPSAGHQRSGIIWSYKPLKALWLVWDFHLKKVINRRDTQIIFIQFAYYTALLPIYHDAKTDQFVLQKTFGGLFCWLVMLGFIFTSATTLVVAQANTFIFHPFVISKVTDVIPLLFTAFLVFVGILHLHTALKRSEIVQLINAYNQHIHHFRRQNGEHYVQNDVVGRVVKMAIIHMFCMSVLASSLYLFRCDFHFLESALPICIRQVEPNGRLRAFYKPVPEFLFYLVLQLLTATQLNCGMFPYIAVGLTIVYDGLEMIKELATRRQRLGKLEPTSSWIIEYRAFQLLSKQVNECLGLHFLPIHLSEIMGLAVLSSYIIIRLDLEPVFVISLLSLELLILYFLSVWKKGSAFIKLSTEAIQSQKMSCKEALYSKRIFWSCKPISIDLGGYLRLKESLILAAFATILDCTISLLLLY